MTEAHTHGPERLCEAGTSLYVHALREGHVRVKDVVNAPCLIDHGLLQPTAEDLELLEPISPAVALHRLLRVSEERIANERQREEQLAEAFAALMQFEERRSPTADNPAIRVITREQINPTITEATAHASQEMLCIQPNIRYSAPHAQAAGAIALDRDQALLDRGGRIRTPANEGGTLALEVRQPAMITYLSTVFDRLWRLATPMHPENVQQPSLNGIMPRQRAIAALLVEGHTDAAITDRLGLNIRTARVHIAKLAATLGSESRAQLGYLIGQSGILDLEG